MITFKCSNCGGEMTISHTGELMCPYCGSKQNFSDKELEGYKVFRQRMLEYLVAVSEDKAKASDYDYLWNAADSITFVTEDGDDIRVRYIYTSDFDGVKMYVAKESVIYVFPKDKSSYLEKALSNIRKISFPQADMKVLNKCIPQGKGTYRLVDGSMLWAVVKDEGLFPVPLFGNLAWEDVAWIVSRLENIACLLEYNDVVHGGINQETIFINPKTHEAALFGGWWKMSNMSAYNRSSDLKDIRATAKKLIGNAFNDIPPMFKDFISQVPINDAFKDFEHWDEVIEKGLGGRHFHKFGE